MRFELTKEYLDELVDAIVAEDRSRVAQYVDELHPADIAEIFDELDIDQARFVYLQLDKELSADVLVELEDDVKERFLSYLSAKEIAAEFIHNMDSDDAADMLQNLPEEKQEEILSHIADLEHAGDIVDLLNYDKDSAGGLMATELVAINENLTVNACLEEIRKQAEELDEIFFVYVVDDDGVLQGTLPLKQLIISELDLKIKNISDKEVIAVKTDAHSEEVSAVMDKYDLVVLPVVDSIGRLKGRITIDDVLDVIREEAEKDYRMTSGISGDVESSDTVFMLTKARIPWLVIGLVGGIFGAMIIGVFEVTIQAIPAMAMFIPLIAAMGGNVGIQSSSIIVKGLANNSLGFESTFQKLLKELSVALTNGIILASILFGLAYALSKDIWLSVTASISLLSVIVFASLFGTFVPLGLHRLKIDPALATGPFITTTNDVIGMLIYFGVGKILLGL